MKKMVSPLEVYQFNRYNRLYRQTGLSARIDDKGLSGALANRSDGRERPPPGHQRKAGPVGARSGSID
ncbi:MAG: hypothetical protein AB7H71_11955, partial [Alphaproteobacteria bacterium]